MELQDTSQISHIPLRVDIENEVSAVASSSTTNQIGQDVVFEFEESKGDSEESSSVRRLKCDKESLGKASPAFLSWLSGNWKDSNVIRMEYYSYETIEALISFVESHEFESDNLSFETIILLYDLATQYLIESLKAQCLAHFESKLVFSSINDIFVAYDTYPHPQIRNIITQYLNWRIDDDNCHLISEYAFKRRILQLFSEARCHMLKLIRGESMGSSPDHPLFGERPADTRKVNEVNSYSRLSDPKRKIERMQLLLARIRLYGSPKRSDDGGNPAEKSKVEDLMAAQAQAHDDTKSSKRVTIQWKVPI